MNITFVCNEYPGLVSSVGGIGVFVQTLGSALARRGYRVSVVGLYSTGGYFVRDDVRILCLPQLTDSGVSALVNLGRMRAVLGAWERSMAAGVVEAPELGLAPLAAMPSRSSRVIRMHGGHHFFSHALGRRPRRLRGWLERLSFASADALCGVSHYVADETRRLLSLGPRQITILPNPVDTVRFRPRPDIAVVPGRILFVGTLVEKKGIRQLVQALEHVARSVPEAHLVAVGRDWRDPTTGRSFRAQLEAQLPAPLRERVTFRGAVPNDEIPEILASAAVCAYPSHMEAMPVAWIEALSAGRPFVASNTGPGPEVVEDGVTGLLCNPHDPLDIADKVTQLLRDRRRAEGMGQAARRFVEQHFSVDVLVQRNEQFYADCLAHG